jgi:hypothetical protein
MKIIIELDDNELFSMDVHELLQTTVDSLGQFGKELVEIGKASIFDIEVVVKPDKNNDTTTI